MSIERHHDTGWVEPPPGKPKPAAPVFRLLNATGRYYARESDTTTHDGVYMAVKAGRGRDELSVTFGPPGAFIMVELSLDAALALADEIRKAVEAGRATEHLDHGAQLR
jgi:hypothetical protein